MNGAKIRLILLGMGVACSFYWVIKSAGASKAEKEAEQVQEVPALILPVLEYYQFKHLRADDLADFDKLYDGVKLSVLDMGVMIAGQSNMVETVISAIAEADIPRKQIDIDVKVIDVTQSEGEESSVKWLVDTLSQVPDKVSVGYDGGLNVGFLTGDLSFAYEVLEETGKCVINANPVLSCLESETARISFGEKRPIVTDTSTTDGGTQNSSYEYRNIGLSVDVTPHCGESNTVQMIVRQISEDITGSTAIDGNEVPLMSSRELSSSVRCQNGETLILGGMKKTNTDEVEVRVPLLSRIPLAGRLFKSTEYRKRDVELCVMLKPSVR